MYVKTLQLENIRGFSSINFDLERRGGTYSGWTVFVGGNASGKSTLLKSIALALMGPEKGAQLLGTPVGWIKEGEKRGEILLKVYWDENDDSFGKRGKLPRGPLTLECASSPTAKTQSCRYCVQWTSVARGAPEFKLPSAGLGIQMLGDGLVLGTDRCDVSQAARLNQYASRSEEALSAGL